jgi:hypothetical protein
MQGMAILLGNAYFAWHHVRSSCDAIGAVSVLLASLAECSGIICACSCLQKDCPPAALQTLYNHSSPRIVSQLLSQWHAQPADQHNHNDSLTAEAAEVLAEASVADHQASASSAASSEQQGPASVLHHASGAVLLQVPVAGCGCATFGQMFDWLLSQRGMVACGLYRQTKHQGRRLQYVYTNPDKMRGCICITWPERTRNA